VATTSSQGKGVSTSSAAAVAMSATELQEYRERNEQEKPQGNRFGPMSMIGFLLLLICVPGLCCWFCWIKVLNKGEGRKARSLPEIVDMESVSGVSTRTEPTVSAVESSACQVQSEDIFATRELKDHDAPVQAAVCCPQVCPQRSGDVVRSTPLNTRRSGNPGHVMAL